MYYITDKYILIWTSYCGGKRFQWRHWVFNGGKPFYTYRLGPIILRVKDH